MSTVIQMRGIRKSFPGVDALKGVDLTLRKGEIHAVMGENGAGKSTLIKTLTGVHRHDAGKILLHDKPVTFKSPGEAQNAGIATVYQEVNLTDNLSVAENLFAGREKRFGPFINFRDMRRQARQVLRDLGLDLDVTAPLSHYSLAMQQLVAIARAVTMEAQVLVLDEPTSSLDKDEVKLLLKVMRALADQGVSLVFISHFLDQVYDVCDRMTVLRGGELIGEWGTSELSQYELIEHMLGREVSDLASLSVEGRNDEVGPEAVVAADNLGRTGSIEPFDLEVKKGEIVGLAGLLGAGRTEAARLITGADHADNGQLSVHGKKQNGYGPRDAIAQGVAYCSEDRKGEGLIPDLTVAENIVIALQAARGWVRRIPAAERDRVVRNYIEKLDIRPSDPDMPVRNLSGGNQQKVILARWLLMDPRLLVLDEPTRGIDVGAKADIQRLVTELSADGMGVVFISAELEEVVRLSHRIAVLKDHKMIDTFRNTADTTTDDIVDTIAAGGRPC
ncbi:sugar ABC transporter ATP-binding protein [Haloglycomyces albus]|uniref:sugar ABC transporter ATP-binding protein n=1 Tax=Haloglycomyces albus TaxID=526067 RepID=UPI00046D5AA6|nr:sugar ABC transporter ATP-binding protein [Haloglycomyces albus]